MCLVLVLLGPIAGCAPQTDREPPSVLWILWDTVRADRLSLYGNPRPTTPFVDQWARQARVYDNCLSVASTTVPAPAALPAPPASGRPPWALSPCGILGEEVPGDWLEHRDPSRPYFAFLDFMEAHAPIITPSRYRATMLTPAEVQRSYGMNLTPAAIWRHTFGLQDFPPEDLEVIRGTYDATLRAMDDMLQTLLTRLEQSGALRNTIVVLCSDHGELLGEHHMLDHQYSLAEPLLRVPLVLHYPPAVKRGRELRPVMNLDLYPPLLELAGIDVPRRPTSLSISLLAPVAERTRIAESPTPPLPPFEEARQVDPTFDPTPYLRSLRAIRVGTLKYTWSSDGRNTLHDLGSDPGELDDRLARDPQRGAELAASLERIVTERQTPGGVEPSRAG